MSARAGDLPSGSGPGDQPRSVWRLLVDPHFGGVFWGKFASFAAVMVQTLVVSVMAFGATGSSSAVAVATSALFAPQILLGPWSGAVSDRGYAVHQIVVGRLLCAAGALILGGWWSLADDTSGWAAVAVITATAAVSGVGLAVGAAAMNSLVPQLVRHCELPRAMSLNTVPITVARVAGPVVGAFVIAAAGMSWALVWAAVGHVVFVATVLAIRLPAGPRRARGEGGTVRAAVAHVVHGDRVLLRLLVAVSVLALGTEPVFTLAPSFAELFGGGATLVGWFSASFGLGAAVGLALVFALESRTAHSVLIAVGLGVVLAGAVVAALAPVAWVVHVAFAVNGLGFTLAMSAASTVLQMRVPDELRGRVMGLWLIGFVGLRPVAALLVGVVSDLADVRAGMAVAALVVAAGCWYCRPSRLR